MASTAGWDDTQWFEKADNSWTAGCRQLQSWWRHKQNFEPGPVSEKRPRLVTSLLPIGHDTSANFFGPKVVAAIEARLASGLDAGIINTDRLYRNLLSSQPACFNLFGEFAEEPNALLPWVQTIDAEATSVRSIDFEWAPSKKEHFNGGSAFDSYVVYHAGGARRFLGIECKYAEDLAKSNITVRQPYIDFTDSHGDLWIEGASHRLNVPQLRQFWLNTLLGQSLKEKENFDAGRVVVIASKYDTKAEQATALVRSELRAPDSSIVWAPYETVTAAMRPTHPDWADWFTERYLDFSPVAHRLSENDPRRSGASDPDLEGFRKLQVLGTRVCGDEGVVAQILEHRETPNADLLALDARAQQLADDLRALREALARFLS